MISSKRTIQEQNLVELRSYYKSIGCEILHDDITTVFLNDEDVDTLVIEGSNPDKLDFTHKQHLIYNNGYIYILNIINSENSTVREIAQTNEALSSFMYFKIE